MARRWGKLLLKIAGGVLFALVVLLAVGITFTIGWRPIIGARSRALTERRIERTPERLERGRYLVENVMGCVDCHSPRDWNTPGAPPIRERLGSGRSMEVEGFPWIFPPNITPDEETGAGRWTDDMLARAIREGIGHDGRALFPMMPYQNLRHMPDEDLASVITYIRSLAPVRNVVPRTQPPFPLSRLVLSAPQPVTEPVPPPDLSTPERRGAHLVRMASCADCHTPQLQGQPVPGMDFAGGFLLGSPQGDVAAANLTPDPSGIPYYDEALFLAAIRTGHVRARPLNPVMPWVFYRNMTDEDLRAIYAFIRTLQPVTHIVDNAEPPTDCRLCFQRHGGGARN